MQRDFCIFLSVAVFCYWTEASPVRFGTLEFDNLDTDLDNLKYEVEEEDLDDYSKLLDDDDAKHNSKSSNDASNSNTKTTGYKKKNTNKKGIKTKHNVQDLKKIFKVAGARDREKIDDDELYSALEGIAAEAVGVTGKEDRKYRKGTKTRGFHRVHHKDEYKKDKEFYEDDETTGNIKKVGGKAFGIKLGGGAGFHRGHFNHDHLKGVYGKRGYLDKGSSDRQFNGFSASDGYDDGPSSDY